MATIELPFVQLLRVVCEQLHIDVPSCVITVDSEGKFVGYVDVHISRNESLVELVRCWSTPAPTGPAAEEEASRNAVKKLAEELGLVVRDVNYEDLLFYKNLNEQLTANLANLASQYNKLVWEYNFLKECYTTTITQKDEYAAERVKIQQAIQECHEVVNRSCILPAAIIPAPLSDTAPGSVE